MNMLEAVVTKIESEPEYKYGKWFVKCTVNAYGRESQTDAMFSAELDAKALKIGDKLNV